MQMAQPINHNFYVDEDYSLHLGLLLSALVHIIAFLYFRIPTENAFAPPPAITVTIEPPSPASQKVQPRANQMVSPSQTQSEPPKDTNLESDTDSAVQKQQIKRGQDNSGPIVGPKELQQPPAPKQEHAQPQPPKPQKEIAKQETKELKQQEQAPQQKNAPQKPLIDLKLDTSTLIDKFALPVPQQNKTNALDAAKNQKANLSNYRAFSRPMGSGAMFIGLSGSSDYLPNLPDGDITLLNAKANQFAVFVRRVATQVFSLIRLEGWDSLGLRDIESISGYSTVTAVLSPEGKLLSVSLESSSQSRKFDDVIVAAAKKGAKDPNPPKAAAASDGNVHFTFQAKSWVEVVPAGRSGIPTERRWLLLATGLD